METRGIWEIVPLEECHKRTNQDPVTIRWVDTNKHFPEDMFVRSRLVARDFKGGDKGRDDLFAETPPLEAKRLLLSRAVTRKERGYRKLMFIDARKAHLNPKCEEDVYINLPEECGCPENHCGKLVYWLYGFRPAAAAWEKHYTSLLENVGFVRGGYCGVDFIHPSRDINLVVHGDDFTACAEQEELRWLRENMESWFEIKVRAILGPDQEDNKEVTILGRIVRWTSDGDRI